jgi:hypothetical protein
VEGDITSVMKVKYIHNAIATFLGTIMLIVISSGCVDHRTPSDNAVNQEKVPNRGNTEQFIYADLKLEITDVHEIKTESHNDDSGTPVEYSIYICYSGASVSILAADTSSAENNADGKSHPRWGVLLKSGDRVDIMDNMDSFEVTSDVLCIYNIESSMSVIEFLIKED